MADSKFEERDMLLATSLAIGTSATDAAKQLNIGRSTIQRHLADPEFRALVASLRGEMIASALGRMSESLTQAADTVRSLLDSPEPHIRLRAARLLFVQVARLRDSVDLGDRFHDLVATVVARLGGKP